MSPTFRPTMAAVVTTLALAAPALSQEPHRITAEDITGIRNAYDIQLSPDGRRVAFVVEEPAPTLAPRITRRETVWMVGVDDSLPPRSVTVVPGDSTANTSAPRWAPDSTTLAVISDAGSSGSQIYAFPVATDGTLGASRRITTAPNGIGQYAWAPDGAHLGFTAQDAPSAESSTERAHSDAIRIDRDLTYTRLWTIAVSSSDATPVAVTRDSLDVKAFAWAPDGNSFAVIATDKPLAEEDFRMRLVTVDRASGRITRQLADGMSLTNSLRWSPDGAWITFMEFPPGRGYAYWLSVVSPDGSRRRALLKDERLTVLRVEWLPDSRHLLAVSVEGTRQKISEIDVASGSRRIVSAVGTSQAAYGISTNGDRVAYFDETSASPVDVWVMDRSGSRKRRLTTLNPQTATWQLGAVRPLTWKNAVDGTALHGVLVTPPDYVPGRRYPTIVQAHQGDLPWWEGFFGYWWSWAQLLAAKGYAVFLPNTRGVTGQGWRLHETLGDWGGLVTQDLIDGVNRLVKDGVADPNALGIGGWSNGAFVTEWTITHSTLFKAAVAESGHSDLFSIAGTSGGMRAGLQQRFGSQILRQREYDRHSAVRFITRATAPTLVLHGARDSAVPVGQGYEFFYGLRSAGVNTEMVVYPSEGHGIQSRGNQIDLLNRVVAWFDAHLRPPPQ